MLIHFNDSCGWGDRIILEKMAFQKKIKINKKKKTQSKKPIDHMNCLHIFTDSFIE